jgi:hypothetical protein
MSGMYHGSMSQEELSKQAKQFMDGSEEAKQLANILKEDSDRVERAKRGELAGDYTVRRKKIYKGKVIPKGFVFIVIKVKTKRGHVEAHQGIPGGQGQEYENQVAESLRELIRTKYGF